MRPFKGSSCRAPVEADASERRIGQLCATSNASVLEKGLLAESGSRFVPARFPADALASDRRKWIPSVHSIPVPTEAVPNRKGTSMDSAVRTDLTSCQAPALAGATA